jgi:hypothetical protein
MDVIKAVNMPVQNCSLVRVIPIPQNSHWHLGLERCRVNPRIIFFVINPKIEGFLQLFRNQVWPAESKAVACQKDYQTSIEAMLAQKPQKLTACFDVGSNTFLVLLLVFYIQNQPRKFYAFGVNKYWTQPDGNVA